MIDIFIYRPEDLYINVYKPTVLMDLYGFMMTVKQIDINMTVNGFINVYKPTLT